MPVFNLSSVIIIMIFYTQKNIQEKERLIQTQFWVFCFLLDAALKFCNNPF